MKNISDFKNFVLLLEERGSSLAVRFVVKDIINLFKSGITSTFILPHDRNTSFKQYVYKVEDDFDDVEDDQNYRQYVKENLENEFTINYEEIEDTFLDYIDSGKIKSRELENWNNSLRWPRSISKSNLFYFLNNFEYCLILGGEFQEDPFFFVDDETDMDDYWKAKSTKESSNKSGIYFEMSLNCDFVNKFKSNLFDDTDFLISGYQNTLDSVYKRRLIFEMVKSIFYRFQKLHTNVDVFYRIRETYDCSGTHPFAVIQFKVEFPETISESIDISEFTPEFLDDEDIYDEEDDEDEEDDKKQLRYDFPDFPVYFWVELKLFQDTSLTRFRIDASAGAFDIAVEITYNPEQDMNNPKFWDELSAELNVDVAHELEHLLQNYYGEFQNSQRYRSNFQYYMLPVEVPAQVAGFKRLYDLEKRRNPDVKFEDLVKTWFLNRRYISRITRKSENTIIANIVNKAKSKYPHIK